MMEQALEIDILKNLTLDMHQGINTVTENVEYLESGIPILQSKHITKGFLNLNDTKYLSQKDYSKYKDKYQANIDDVLVCNIGTIGKSLRIQKADKFLIAWNLFLIKLDNRKLYSQYFAHYLNHLSDQNYFDRFLTGGTVKFINKKTMEKIQVPIPPLPQQQKIANILDAAVTLKQNDKALIAKYDALTQALFLEMFGDPVRNPKGWEKVELKNLTQPIKKLGKDYKSPSINYVDISSIDNTKFLIVSTTEYLFEERPSRAQQILKKNDVLLSTVRPNLKNIAINKTDDLIASTGFYVCRVNEQLNSKFLFEVLKSDSVTNHFVGITAGANYPAVKSSDISKFQVVLPPIELQNQFAERVALIEEQKAIAQKSLEKSEALCNSLLQKAFNGGLT